MSTRTIVVIAALSAVLAVVAFVALLTGGPDQRVSSVALILSFLGMLVAHPGAASAAPPGAPNPTRSGRRPPPA